MTPDPDHVREDIRRALLEDAANDDITAALVPDQHAGATITCRCPAVLCGTPWAACAFQQIDPGVTLDWTAADGERVEADTPICQLHGPARSLLRGERVALNFLQLMSATASRTSLLKEKLGALPCTLLDTRKTLPGLRYAQKYAVQCGGGTAHRFSLADAVLIKENHLTLLTDLTETVRQARTQSPAIPVIVEVETLAELATARAAKPDVILLDNFSPDLAREAVAQCPDIPLEASGNITEDTIADYAKAGIARISAGTLTKDVQAVDFSMRLFSL